MNHPDWRDVPVFCPDPPYHDDPRAYAYYAGALRRMAEFITRHTAKALDMDRLEEAMAETNRGYELWSEYAYLRRAPPMPAQRGMWRRGEAWMIAESMAR